MRHRKHVLTTGETANMLGVAQRTIGGWMTNGDFPNAYRIPTLKRVRPGSGGAKDAGDRRIPITDVLAFAAKHRIILSPAWNLGKCITLVECPPGFTRPEVPAGVELRTRSFVGAARDVADGGVNQYVIWTAGDSRLAAELAALVPEWQPRPVIVPPDEVGRIAGAPETTRYHRAGEIPWGRLFAALDERIGTAPVIACGAPESFPPLPAAEPEVGAGRGQIERSGAHQ